MFEICTGKKSIKITIFPRFFHFHFSAKEVQKLKKSKNRKTICFHIILGTKSRQIEFSIGFHFLKSKSRLMSETKVAQKSFQIQFSRDKASPPKKVLQQSVEESRKSTWIVFHHSHWRSYYIVILSILKLQVTTFYWQET